MRKHVFRLLKEIKFSHVIHGYGTFFNFKCIYCIMLIFNQNRIKDIARLIKMNYTKACKCLTRGASLLIQFKFQAEIFYILIFT